MSVHKCYGAVLVVVALLHGCGIDAPINATRPDAGVPAPPPTGGTGGQAQPPAGGGGPVVVPPSLDPDMILASGCATSSQVSSLLPSNLLFVVDRSGSMRCNPPPVTPSEVCEAQETLDDPATPSKWLLTTMALRGALSTLPDTTAVGVSYFSNDSKCGVSGSPNVPVARNTMAQQMTISTSLAATQPNGSTPLVGATLLAYQYLHNAALSGAITGNRYVVLITDGQQSEKCSDPMFCDTVDECSSLLIEETAKASGEGVNIRTFVIGVPGSERGKTVLSRIAQAGGTPKANCNPELGNCHFDVTGEADLGAALQRDLKKIAGQTLTCELELPQTADGKVDLSRLNVVFFPHEARARIIPKSDKLPCDGGADGWQYDSAQGQIRLCGGTCASVRNDRGGRIDVVLGCPVIAPD